MDMQVNYGILALVPPIIAIGLCFATKQVLISMFAGLFAGSLIISSWNPLGACSYALSVISSNMADNVILLLFTLFMGVGISFIWKLGGSFALAEAAKRRFKKRRSVCLGTWGLGMAAPSTIVWLPPLTAMSSVTYARITEFLPRNCPMY